MLSGRLYDAGLGRLGGLRKLSSRLQRWRWVGDKDDDHQPVERWLLRELVGKRPR
jgi:hypothetical protein